MKNLILALIASAVALTFVACEPTTTVKWTAGNDLTGDVTDIVWLKGATTDIDQQWSETLNNAGTDTSSLGVEALAGKGDCLLNGEAALLTIDENASEGIVSASADSAVLKENESINLVISSVTAK